MSVSKTKQRKRKARRERARSFNERLKKERAEFSDRAFVAPRPGMESHADLQLREEALSEGRGVPTPADGARAYVPHTAVDSQGDLQDTEDSDGQG